MKNKLAGPFLYAWMAFMVASLAIMSDRNSPPAISWFGLAYVGTFVFIMAGLAWTWG